MFERMGEKRTERMQSLKQRGERQCREEDKEVMQEFERRD